MRACVRVYLGTLSCFIQLLLYYFSNFILLFASQLSGSTLWFLTALCRKAVNIHSQPEGFFGQTKNCFVSFEGLNVMVLPLRTVMAFFQNV
jgi:hypothetical protein